MSPRRFLRRVLAAAFAAAFAAARRLTPPHDDRDVRDAVATIRAWREAAAASRDLHP